MKHNSEKVADNVVKHQSIYEHYDAIHPEIYNLHEQSRLKNAIAMAMSYVKTSQPNSGKLLDFGCGSGNLSKFLIEYQQTVIAADVTPEFVKSVTEKLGRIGSIEGYVLNGLDLSELPSNSIDFIGTYSVLHHVPDYLHIVSEFARVLKPGGVLYIDHERSPAYWDQPNELREFLIATRRKPSFTKVVSNFLKPSWYSKRFKKIVDPRYQEEGDIHVWADDHIEWQEIEKVLGSTGVSIVCMEDYLMYLPTYDWNLFEMYRGKCNDLRMVIAIKG